MAKPEYDNTNRGVIFRNYDKEKLKDERDTSKWANAQGSLNVYGVEFYISAWSKIIKSGENKGDKMQQVSIKPVDEKQGKKLEQLINKHILGNNFKEDKEDLPDDINEGGDDLPF